MSRFAPNTGTPSVTESGYLSLSSGEEVNWMTASGALTFAGLGVGSVMMVAVSAPLQTVGVAAAGAALLYLGDKETKDTAKASKDLISKVEAATPQVAPEPEAA